MTPTFPKLDRLLTALRAEPNCTIEELAEETGMTRDAAYHQLYRARKAGVPILVRRVNDHGESRALYRMVDDAPRSTLMVRVLRLLDDRECWTTRQIAVVLGAPLALVCQCLRKVLMPKGLVSRRRAPRREHGPKFYYFHPEAIPGWKRARAA